MKKFENLILECVDSDITGSTSEKMQRVKEIFESEMLSYTDKSRMTHLYLIKRLQDWLQGLCSTVSLPFYSHDVLAWYEKELNRPIKEKEEDRLLDKYWENAAKTLFWMLYGTKYETFKASDYV